VEFRGFAQRGAADHKLGALHFAGLERSLAGLPLAERRGETGDSAYSSSRGARTGVNRRKRDTVIECCSPPSLPSRSQSKSAGANCLEGNRYGSTAEHRGEFGQ
jgi:hypothetical protein